MFTGIIKNLGVVKDINDNSLIIKTDDQHFLNIDLGTSVSVDGVCLTVRDIEDNNLEFQISNESKDRSIIKGYKNNINVNLELPTTVNDFLSGHIVQGHVDDIAKCIKKIDQENSWLFTFEFSEKFSDLIIEKGSICINGVSLTCFDTSKNNFTVAIIPHTYDNTNFKLLDEGDYVNLEFDILGKYIKKIIRT